jgi:hypothetical protein
MGAIMDWRPTIAIALAVSASAQGQPPAPGSALNIVCTGTALKDESVGTTLDFLAGNVRTEKVGTMDSVSFQINSDNTGTGRLPRRLQSPYREANPDGSFRLIEVVRGQDEITGKVRLHAMYKPKFRLDRITGVLTLNGSLGDFSGRCEAYDPATVQRKF